MDDEPLADEVLLDMVTGMGQPMLEDVLAAAVADTLDVQVDPHADMRGIRDLDHSAPSPWRQP